MKIRDSKQLKTVWALYDQNIEQKDYSQVISDLKIWRTTSWIRKYRIEILRPATIEAQQGHRRKAEAEAKCFSHLVSSATVMQERASEWSHSRFFGFSTFANIVSEAARISFGTLAFLLSIGSTLSAFSPLFDSKGRTRRGSIPSGQKFQKPSQKYLKKTCTDPLCNCWLPPECQRYKTKEGCSYGDKCAFLYAEKTLVGLVHAGAIRNRT